MKNSLTKTQSFLIKNARLSLLFFVGAVIITTFITINNSAQTFKQTTGKWSATIDSDKRNALNIVFTRHLIESDHSYVFENTTRVALDNLQNVSAQTLSSGSPDVSFKVAREAGIFEFKGSFNQNKGSGVWDLKLDQGFAAAMRDYGYDNLNTGDLVGAAMNDLTVKYVADLRSAGYGNLEFGKLLRARKNEVTPGFIRDLQSAGFENLTIDQIIRAKSSNINGSYVKQARALKFDEPLLETLVEIQSNKITLDFVREMRSAGFEKLSVDRLIKLKKYEITPEFVNDLRAEGLLNLSPETVVRLKRGGIDRDFIQRVKAKGFSNLTLEQLVKLRSQNAVK